MTERHDGDAEMNRRGYLKLAGVAAAVGTTGMVGSVGAAQSEPQTDQVVNLGDEGLTSGDSIDSYLEEHFTDGVEVRIPAGEYDWGGGSIGGDIANAALIGEGEVIFNAVEGEFGPTVKAQGGVVRFANVTVREPVADSRIRLQASEEATIIVENMNFPDGTAGDSKPFYVPGEHAGEVQFHNCYIKEFDDNAIYASSPGKEYGKGGRVVIDSCFAQNCNVASFRLGGTDSVLRNSVVLNDDKAPADEGGSIEQRGIRLENNDKSQNMLVENCDVVHTHTNEDESSNPIVFREAAGSSGRIENVRIRNDTPHEAIEDDEDALPGWSGNNISVTGSGNMFVPDKFTNVCTGDGCTEASTDIGVGPGSTDGDSGSGSSGSTGSGSTEPTKLLELHASPDNPSTALDVSVTTTGRIDYGAEAEADTDEIVENDDGTYTATSIELDPDARDSYRFRGEVQSVSYPEGYDVTVTVDGTEIEPDDGSSDDSTDDGSVPPTDGDDSSGPALAKRVIVDGTGSEEFAKYRLTVSGEIENDPAVSSGPDATPWDQFDDHVDGNTVVGTVHKGIDGYRYAGELTDLEIDGDVNLTIEDSA